MDDQALHQHRTALAILEREQNQALFTVTSQPLGHELVRPGSIADRQRDIDALKQEIRRAELSQEIDSAQNIQRKIRKVDFDIVTRPFRPWWKFW